MHTLRAQILADGLFHALMYVIAFAGLVWLWRSRQGLAVAGGSRRLWSGVMIGFGAWNVVDVGLFHWILGIHHIRLDVPNPIAWDAGWLIGLGLAPIVAGIAVAGAGSDRSRRASASAAGLLALLVGAGLWNLRPPPGGADTLVLFRPGADMIAAIVAVDAGIIELDPGASLAVLRLPPETPPWRLYRHGAILVQGAGPSGCLNWSARKA